MPFWPERRRTAVGLDQERLSRQRFAAVERRKVAVEDRLDVPELREPHAEKLAPSRTCRSTPWGATNAHWKGRGLEERETLTFVSLSKA